MRQAVTTKDSDPKISHIRNLSSSLSISLQLLSLNTTLINYSKRQTNSYLIGVRWSTQMSGYSPERTMSDVQAERANRTCLWLTFWSPYDRIWYEGRPFICGLARTICDHLFGV